MHRPQVLFALHATIYPYLSLSPSLIPVCFVIASIQLAASTATPVRRSRKEAVVDGFGKAKFSTASMGRFDPKHKQEPSKLHGLKGVLTAAPRSKARRKTDTVPSDGVGAGEKGRSMKVLDRVLSKAPDVNPARVSRAMDPSGGGSSSRGGGERGRGGRGSSRGGGGRGGKRGRGRGRGK